MRVAVIPARGGSKRIPRKNIKPFCGKPMIAWSIEAAKQSMLFDRILVSTDDHIIAEVAGTLGVEVPFMRQSNLADDYVGTTEVIAHAVLWMMNQGWSLDAVCCIYATAALVQSEDLNRGWKALDSGNWSYALSVTKYDSSIFRSFKIHSGGGLEMFFPEKWEMRSQDLPIALYDAAQFYWGRPEAWANSLKIFDHYSYPVQIPSWRVQDVDTLEDWRSAELKFRILEQEKKILSE
jgi:pseudaminic acid cytidylyltransferase